MEFIKLMLVLMLSSLAACGQHSSESRYFQKVGEETIIDESQEPLDQMQRAIFDGDIGKVNKLLENGIKVDAQLPSGRTILAEATYYVKVKIIRLMIQLGADISQSKIEGEELIKWCEQHPDRNKLLRALLKNPLEDKTEMMLAVLEGKFQSVKILLQEGVSANFIDSDTGESPLTIAIKKKLINTLRALFTDSQLDVNLKNTQGESPLQISKKLNLRAIESELIKRNASE